MSYFVRFRSSRLFGCNEKSEEITFVRFYTEVIKIDVDASYKGIPIPEAQKILLVESGILDFGICNTALGIRNCTIRDPSSSDKKSRIHDVESRMSRLSWVSLHKRIEGFAIIIGQKGNETELANL